MEEGSVEIAAWKSPLCGASLQTPMSLSLWASFNGTRPISHCHEIWVCSTLYCPVRSLTFLKDIERARFTPCFLSAITATPAVIAALILLIYSLRFFRSYRPRWMKPFIQETKEKVVDLDAVPKRQIPIATLTLLAVSIVGLVLQALTIFFPTRQVIEIYPSIAWVSMLTIQLTFYENLQKNRPLLLRSL